LLELLHLMQADNNPSSSSSFSWHNTQFTSPCTQEKQNDVCLHVYNTSILCICRSSGQMLVNARFRIHTTAADSASQWTYSPIFFQLLNFAQKSKIEKWSNFARVQLPKLRTQKKKKKRAKNLSDFYIWFSVCSQKILKVD
jgi:hypothetical protein